MKNKIILAVIVIFAIILVGIVYYVKNVMIIPDKNGMVYEEQNDIALNDEEFYKGDD